ncbi:3-dehydroquinate dehydratase, type II [Exophiala oligosperma]|uniref:Catabolic 3-dehydroquinase n=1 Tax=Exophiala oligosperma TaxID=215243 RepID=A0A0D2AR62_9EURO|nr:3-dehydroquinate dehydratase, type II [Exophiala oligosperma]KIW42421.1 3-dehydroquinate dehydratase, type II [Exophiala oligosperma]
MTSIQKDNTPSSPSPRKVLLINGPNLNLLGTREPGIYGSTTLSDIVENVKSRAQSMGITIVPFQSNHEGAIVDFLHSHFSPRQKTAFTGVIINPAAFTHTSVAIRDALLATSLPFVEVHISNVHAREPFRAHSYFSDKAQGVIMGLGAYGYIAALEFWAQKWDVEEKEREKEGAQDGSAKS